MNAQKLAWASQSNPLLNKPTQGFQVQCGVCALHKGNGNPAMRCRRPWKDRCNLHPRELANHGFQLLRVDVHAVEHKHVIGAAAQCQTPLRIEFADIARVKPAGLALLSGQFRLVQIAPE